MSLYQTNFTGPGPKFRLKALLLYCFVINNCVMFFCGCLNTGKIIPPPREKPTLESLLRPGFKTHWRVKGNGKYSYPIKLLKRGITGWVAVKFNILEDGSVSEVSVIDSSPPKIFDKYAVYAISHRKYKYIGPDETPTESIGNVVIIDYDLKKK